MGEVVAHPASNGVEREIDWEAIEREYRAGQLSVIEIARQQGLSHTAINKRAKKSGWTRDLSAQVRREVRARLSVDLPPPPPVVSVREPRPVSSFSAETISETISETAERGVAVVRSHRRYIGEGLKAAIGVLDEVNLALVERTEPLTIKDIQALSISAMNAASSLHKLVQLERQAFHLDERDEPASPGLIEITEQNARDYARKVAFILSQRQAQPVIEGKLAG